MNIKSKIKKYVHKCLNLSRVNEFAHLESLIFIFEHMGHLKIARGTRWSSQILQKVPRIVSRVHETRKAKKEVILAHFNQARQGRARSTSVYQARSLRVRSAHKYEWYTPPHRHLVGHAHTHTISFKALVLSG